MRDDPSVVDLVHRAGAGDQGAWNEIVDRYAQLVWSICSRYRLSRHDIDEVGQNVWLSLVEKIGTLREPAALPGWLATTCQRECLRVLRAGRDHAELPSADQLPPAPDTPMIEEAILAAERDVALRAAFAELPHDCRALLSLLISDPPHSYTQISASLGMPVGSIGPTRARCLDRLRRSPHVMALTGTGDIAVMQTKGTRDD